MLEQILEGQSKLVVDFNSKFDAIYTDLNGKIDNLSSHMKKLDVQEIHDAKCKAIMEKILTTIPKDASENSSAQLLRYVKRLVNNGLHSEEANLLTRDMSSILLKKVKNDRSKRVVLSEHVSSTAKGQSTEILSDPGSFVLDSLISTRRFSHSFCHLGTRINLMPKSVAGKLGMTNYMPTRITLLFADRSNRIPQGILDDVPLKLGKCLILADFVVLAYDEEPKDPLILGIAFLATPGARIDVKKDRISLNICDVEMEFGMDGSEFIVHIRSIPTNKDTSSMAAQISPPSSQMKAAKN
ncbi:hypothetical protein AXX17_ATUG01050 [Arabidopsis thaliana]|uniref:Uncharacterized protein n=2 Tax=Arabidopsis TaxID=3701 RepID=A0A178U646_ARATH|nr:hypothetical protein AXX17_ATUG01050 [Arabidopsis thaliana]